MYVCAWIEVYCCPFYRHYIPARTGARKVMAKGAFPRAEVTRGTNWDYGDDDGKEHINCGLKILVGTSREACSALLPVHLINYR